MNFYEYIYMHRCHLAFMGTRDSEYSTSTYNQSVNRDSCVLRSCLSRHSAGIRVPSACMQFVNTSLEHLFLYSDSIITRVPVTLVMTLPMRPSCCFVALLQLLHITTITSVVAQLQQEVPQQHHLHPPDAELFVPADDAIVVGPTSFPKPTDAIEPRGAVPIVLPTHGKHRPGADAVFAYAEGYSIPFYLHFVETLRATGFDGDIVLAIAEERLVHPGVMEYLTLQPNLVIYHSDMDCFAEDLKSPAPRKVTKQGSFDIFQMCCLHQVYGWIDAGSGAVLRKAQDPRQGRVVATLRYEWYWIWLQNYHKNSWIMILDARDSYFQRNPFANVPRQSDPNVAQGNLWFFGENANATRLGKSTKNLNWLRQGYGVQVLDALREKPTICSGSTMGEVVAMEQYLRAEINEKDETEVRMTGSDQGFHNYLYYSHKLANVDAIVGLTVWAQGHGVINNLGALRTRPFVDWGVYNTTSHEVYNWDGSLAPVVHQWDRDKDLHGYLFRVRFRELEAEWNRKKMGKTAPKQL